MPEHTNSQPRYHRVTLTDELWHERGVLYENRSWLTKGHPLRITLSRMMLVSDEMRSALLEMEGQFIDESLLERTRKDALKEGYKCYPRPQSISQI